MTLISKESLAAAADHARQAPGKRYWRTLQEGGQPETNLLLNEFPPEATALPDGVTRRQFVTLMGASLALAGLSGCGAWRQPQEEIVPYVRAPEYLIPGKPLFFATAMELGGLAMGLLAENHMGRPTKLEGNPDHPASLGSTDALAQAAILTLYDPDRSQAVTSGGRIRTYDDFLAALREALEPLREARGAGLHILSEPITSPTLARQRAALLAALPALSWHQYTPLSRDNARAGAELAFGEDLNTVLRFDEAAVILSLDADFLSEPFGSAVRYARDWASRRRLWTEGAGEGELSRLYVAESGYSITGSKADHRARLRSSEVEGLARALAAALGVAGVSGERPASIPAPWFDALVADLRANQGASIVVAGEGQPPAVHALAHALNEALGNVGQTVLYTDSLEAVPENGAASLQALAAAMAGGTVEALLILGGNPAFDAPADLDFAARLADVPFSVHLSLYEDESSALSRWHVPMSHFLEAWGDAVAFDGSVALVQPLIEPLYGGRSVVEMLAVLSDNPLQSGYDAVRATWQERFSELDGADPDFERFWRAALHQGNVPGTALPPRSPRSRLTLPSAPAPSTGMELRLVADPTLYDGRFANNGWLQELPKPITKLTWDNAAYLSPATARALGVTHEDVVELRVGGRSVRAPVWIVPGQADNSVLLSLGYGRERAGRVGSNSGVDGYRLRTTAAPWIVPNLTVAATGERYNLAVTQGHHQMVGDTILKEGTLEEYRAHPSDIAYIHIPGTPLHGAEGEYGAEGESKGEHGAEGEAHSSDEVPSLYPEWAYNGYKWGMAIDMTACTGCNACVMACNAENNIPIVGKDEVARSREMHWLRIDTYYQGLDGDPSEQSTTLPDDPPAAFHMPVPCMHCEVAPCEPVCPVAATVHDSEGLNNMVYNRCVGTRYCSNNCPYKVRRFNFLEYADDESPVLALMRNPDVTTRWRGVMEKCSYCIQRISSARIEADKEERTIADGDVLTACQAACPTQAIIFGDMNDEGSQVHAAKAHPLNYAMLAEMGTKPRTTYLAAIRNPNTAVEG